MPFGMRVVVLAAAVGLVVASSPVLAAPEDALAGRAVADRLAPRPAGALSSSLLSGPALEPGVLLVTTTGRAATDRVVAGRVWRGGAGRVLGGRVARVDVPPGREQAAAAALAANPDVVAVERSRRLTSLARPDDPLYDAQWAHRLGQPPLRQRPRHARRRHHRGAGQRRRRRDRRPVGRLAARLRRPR